MILNSRGCWLGTTVPLHVGLSSFLLAWLQDFKSTYIKKPNHKPQEFFWVALGITEHHIFHILFAKQVAELIHIRGENWIPCLNGRNYWFFYPITIYYFSYYNSLLTIVPFSLLVHHGVYSQLSRQSALLIIEVCKVS